uniref:Uncharacterized protein n=1 Tax=Lotus japonicus TaxID=34305 RepID=I3ST92_LOTJA|nr:unknown [Lotus japonicus]
MEMDLKLGLRQNDEEKRWEEPRGCRVWRIGRAREVAEVVDMAKV